MEEGAENIDVIGPNFESYSMGKIQEFGRANLVSNMGVEVKDVEASFLIYHKEDDDTHDSSCSGLDTCNEGWREQLLVTAEHKGHTLSKINDSLVLVENLIFNKQKATLTDLQSILGTMRELRLICLHTFSDRLLIDEVLKRMISQRYDNNFFTWYEFDICNWKEQLIVTRDREIHILSKFEEYIRFVDNWIHSGQVVSSKDLKTMGDNTQYTRIGH